MKNPIWLIALGVLMLCVLINCGGDDERRQGRAMYYWSTKFELDSAKLAFISEHDIDRIYVRYFDVIDSDDGPVPNATIRFDTDVEAPVEIVPTIFITNNCMKTDTAKLHDVADKLLARVLQMNDTHGIGKVNELQIDCDWTSSTRANYFDFLDYLHRKARAKDVELSTTIRLHQLSQPSPPVDRGVLMVYNTGDFSNIDEEKPILDPDEVRKFAGGLNKYKLPLDCAFPIYRWQLLFRNNKYVGIVHYDGEWPVLKTDTIVDRMASVDDILESKDIISKKRPDFTKSIILFDLNNYNIDRYTSDEFEKFFDNSNGK